MSVTKNVSDYIKKKGFNLSDIARKTGCSYDCIYSSLMREDSTRDLRADELIDICIFIEKDPLDFSDKNYKKEVG